MVYIIVRHGEKKIMAKNPHLSEPGKERTKTFSSTIQKIKIQNAFSTDFFRTRETLEPLILEKKLDLKIYNPKRNSEFVKMIYLKNRSQYYFRTF